MGVVFLEDDPGRLRAFRSMCPRATYFIDANVMVASMRQWLPTATLISLDHDLPFRRDEHGVLHDNGTGRQVADALAAELPRCPVILHTSNHDAMLGMRRVLTDGGWQVRVVTPEPGTRWVEREWLVTADRLLHGGGGGG